MEPISILIADDSAEFRRELRQLLSTEPDLKLIGEADTGEDACDLARDLQPDVVVMDIVFFKNDPERMNGIGAAQRIILDSPHVRILVLTMHEQDHLVFNAMCAGARGYVRKGDIGDNVLRAIRAVASGEAIFSPSIAKRFVSYFRQLACDDARTDVFPELTPREREVLSLMARGLSNHEIATELGISLKTVRNHVYNILCKLQLADRTKAIIHAREAGMR